MLAEVLKEVLQKERKYKYLPKKVKVSKIEGSGDTTCF
jgi:hypothetical protein